jgi:tetratricopeptide (TPR) repeat protein
MKARALCSCRAAVLRASVAVLVCVVCQPVRADDEEACKKGKGDEAVAACTRILDSKSVRGEPLAELFAARGFQNLGLKKYDPAAQDFEESLKINPKASIFLWLGHAYRSQGKLDNAIASYGESIKLNAEDPDTHYFRGNAYRLNNELRKAVEDFDAAIKLDPEDAQLYNARGIAIGAIEGPDAALVEYDTAISKDPEYVDSYVNRGDVRFKKEEFHAAMLDYSTANKKAPDDLIVVYKLANAYRALSEFERAIGLQNQLIEKRPRDPAGYYERAVTRMLAGKPEMAIADFDEAIRLEPGNPELHHLRGLAHAANNAPPNAIADYSEAIRLDPENAHRYAVRAWASHLAGRSYLALIDADKAVALDPELRSALQTRSEIFKSLGRGEDAEADRAAAKALQEKAAAEAEKKSAEARDAASRIKAELVAAELAYFKTFEQEHQYINPLDRTVASLQKTANDLTDYDSSSSEKLLNDEGRQMLRAFQRQNGLRDTGYIDQQTFEKAIDAPVDVSRFEGKTVEPGKAEAIDDWWWEKDDVWCTLWTKPVAIEGRFAPNFMRLPIIKISRKMSDKGNSLSANFGDDDIYEKGSAVVLDTGSEINLENFGGSFRPESYCTNKGCFGKDDVYKGLAAASGNFRVIGKSKFGGDIKIEYSSSGFLEGFKTLDKRCGKGKLGSWLR